MDNSILSQIEDRFSQLSISEQLRIIERLVHRVHEQTVKAGDDPNAQLALMAAEPVRQSKMPRWLIALWPTQYKGRRNHFVGAVGFVSSTLYVVTVVLLSLRPKEEGWARVALILWAVVPPVWFWFDYFILWKPVHPTTCATYKEDLDMFKHGQEISRNIWLAFVATIGLLYFRGS